MITKITEKWEQVLRSLKVNPAQSKLLIRTYSPSLSSSTSHKTFSTGLLLSTGSGIASSFFFLESFVTFSPFPDVPAAPWLDVPVMVN